MFSHPRYQKNPIHLFFEAYIQDVVGELPQEKSQQYQDMNLQSVFNTKASDWKDVIKEVLQLSETIEIAILDLWYTNNEISLKEDLEYDAIQFSMNFVDQYFKDDSKVDVWEGNALESAKARIAKHQKKK